MTFNEERIMIDKNKLPEPIYNEIIEVFGYEKAEEVVNKNNYNFRLIQISIISERMKQKYGRRFWIYFWIVLILFIVIYEILESKMLI